jgi:hypothetical protein
MTSTNSGLITLQTPRNQVHVSSAVSNHGPGTCVIVRQVPCSDFTPHSRIPRSTTRAMATVDEKRQSGEEKMSSPESTMEVRTPESSELEELKAQAGMPGMKLHNLLSTAPAIHPATHPPY